MDEDCAVLLLSAYKDKNGTTCLFEDSLKKIKGVLRQPIFHLWYHGIGNGLLGGKVISHFEQGRNAARIVKEIFAGTPVSRLQVQTQSPNKYVFDYDELTSNHIGIKQLPENSLILNPPDSFYQTNKKIIWITLLIMGILLVALAVSIANILKRLKVEKALKTSEERFKALHKGSFGGILIHDMGRILECNKGLSEITGYTYPELIGMDGWQLINEDTRKKVIQYTESGYEKPYEATGVRKNGEIYPVWIHARKIPFQGKDVRVAEFRDITETKKAAAEKKNWKRNCFRFRK